METIYVCGVGVTPFGRYPDKSIKQLTSEAVNAALQDANGQIADVEAAYFSASTTGYLQGQTFVPGQISLRDMGFEGIPKYNLENSCASGSSGSSSGVTASAKQMASIVL